ncbi:MAG: DUF3667 domain-containing protein [Bacteroidetes bacterium]|jgi:hypothetical protein|nr:DUF3667 domain-containing protein [Bacteroidota bacterium]
MTKSLRSHRGEVCLNCGHQLDVSDKYCPECGQLNSDKKLSAKDMLIEFLGSLFSYDSKLFVSLRALLFSPAKMTKEYLSGMRMKYVNPFRFFISIAILYFIISSLTTDENNFKLQERNQKEDEGIVSYNVSKKNDSTEQKTIEKDSTQVDRQEYSLSDALDENPNLTFEEAVSEYGYKDTMLEEFRFLLNKNAKKSTENSDAFIDYLKSKFPFFMFFFIPMATLILKLLYFRREFTYTDHLVFNYYLSSTFFFLLMIASLLNKFVNSTILDSSIFLIFVVYVIKAFRLFYMQSYFKTVIKLSIFTIFYCILFLVFVLTYIIILLFLF